jgi:twitching motility two-component system response regulator PilG
MPVYEPAVAPLPAGTDALSTSLEEVALQSPVNKSAGFSTAEPPGTPFLAGNAAADPLDGKTVLVVDDSPTVRKLVSITLEKRGNKVASAFDGVAAIKEIAAHNPALILMDVNMPRLDGYQLCKLVKKHETTCDIPVLMLSGTDGMFDRLRGRLVGCAGHVTKPFTPEVLIEAVEQHMTQGKEV